MVTLTSLAAMHGPGPWWNDGPGWDGPPVWFGVVGAVLWLLFWAAVITGAILVWRRYARSRPKPGDTAVAVLGERYARGEITDDEYRQRLAVLHEQRN